MFAGQVWEQSQCDNDTQNCRECLNRSSHSLRCSADTHQYLSIEAAMTIAYNNNNSNNDFYKLT